MRISDLERGSYPWLDDCEIKSQYGIDMLINMGFSSSLSAMFATLLILGMNETMATNETLLLFQPRVITTVESHPARKLAGSLSIATGTPWCHGKPTYWLPGHKPSDETPNCLVNGTWHRPYTAVLDNNDARNDVDGPAVIDRHDCGALDVNFDGIMDLYCLVGANSGTGFGYNELYLTQPNGSLVKVPTHGLQKYPGLRTRYTANLKDANGTDLIFIATKGIPREDGLSNRHRMFRNNATADGYFEEVTGPWLVHSEATCAVAADVTGDGIDDLIVCNEKGLFAFLFVQSQDGTWRKVYWTDFLTQKNWRSVRVADFDGDSIPDLAVVYNGKASSMLRIFRGIPEEPYFNFSGAPFFAERLPFASPDLEVLDINKDGIFDVYVVQSDEWTREPDGSTRAETYCAGTFVHKSWWLKGNQPPTEFVPPLDIAQDVLFIGTKTGRKFEKVVMNHCEPGCGNLARRFGNDQTLLLAQGGFVRPGHNLLLEW